MSSVTTNTVEALSLPQITSVVAGDFLPVFTTNGTKIIDYTNLHIPESTESGGLLLTDTLSAVDINASGTVNSSVLSAENLFINGEDYSQVFTTIESVSSNLYTLINTVSTTITSTSVYQQIQGVTFGSGVSTVAVTFTGIPDGITSVDIANISIISYNSTPVTTLYAPQITTTNPIFAVIGNSITVNVYSQSAVYSRVILSLFY